VAIKVLPPGRARDQNLKDRFLREARTAAKLSHPNIIPIHAVDEAGEFVFFAMAYVDGDTLTERVRQRGPLAPSDAARVLRDVAWALAYAHAQGVIHRDVKPDNILLETGTGRALVADFGIAGVVRGATGLDGGAVLGTPEFMSPEQALGEPTDARCDLYGLGAVAFFGLSGRLPFEGATATEVLAKQVTEVPRPLADVAPGAPRRLAQLVDRCLAKEASDRPPSAVDVAAQLGAALEQRRELPPALKIFVTGQTAWSEANIIAGSFLLVIIMGFVVALADRFLNPVGVAWAVFGTIVGGLVLVPTAMLLNEVRKLANVGFGPEDLARAFKTHLDDGRELRAIEHGRDPSLFERVVRAIAVGSLTGAAALGIGVLSWPVLSDIVWELLGTTVTGLGTGLITVMRIQRRRDLASEVWWRVWSRRLGRWLFNLATLGLKRDAVAPALTHRPTELSLSLAAERLFQDLPKETRHELRELPDVVHRLEQDAQRMRNRLEDLQEATGGREEDGTADGDALGARRARVLADLVAERDAVQRRLADAVAALETIRLNLLKLHAGSTTVRSLTTDLGLAQDVANGIDLLLASRREVDEMLP
jgi:serine/threonine-protein kinase